MPAAVLSIPTRRSSDLAVQALNNGGTLSDTFTVHTADGTAQLVTITIDGTNDAAVVSGTAAGTVVIGSGHVCTPVTAATRRRTLSDNDVDNAANRAHAVSHGPPASQFHG